MTAAFVCATPHASGQAGGVITSPPPPNGVVGSSYIHQFTSNLPDATYSVTNGALPPGVLLGPSSIVTGLPTQAGTFGPTTVCAADGASPPACQTFTIVIAKSTPLVLTSPSAGGPVGTPVRDTASLFGPGPKTGSMTFRLFSDPACTTEVFSSTNVVDADGTATSSDFVPTSPGTYRWTVSYSGDANNNPATRGCTASNEVTITGTTTSTTSTTSTSSTTSTTSTTSTSTTSTTVGPTTTSSTAPTTTSSTFTTSSTSTTVPTGTTSSSTTSSSSTSSSTSSSSTSSSTSSSSTSSSTSSSSTTSTTTPASTTSTSVPPTSTSVPPTSTSVPPTSTSVPPTSTSVPPTSTSTSTTTTVPATTTTSTTTTVPATTTSSTTPTVPATTTSETATTVPATTTTVTPAALTPTTTAPGPTISTDVTQVAPGQNVTVTGSGFSPGDPLAAELFSDPVQLGTTTADASGRFRMVVTVPLGTSPGLHTLRVRAVNGPQFADASVLVVAPAPGPTMRGTQTLSRTGAEFLHRVGWGFLLMGAGYVLVRLAWNDGPPAGFGRRRPPWPNRRHWA